LCRESKQEEEKQQVGRKKPNIISPLLSSPLLEHRQAEGCMLVGKKAGSGREKRRYVEQGNVVGSGGEKMGDAECVKTVMAPKEGTAGLERRMIEKV